MVRWSTRPPGRTTNPGDTERLESFEAPTRSLPKRLPHRPRAGGIRFGNYTGAPRNPAPSPASPLHRLRRRSSSEAGRGCARESTRGTDLIFQIRCRICGIYRIEMFAAHELRDIGPHPDLSGVVRLWSETNRPVVITTENCRVLRSTAPAANDVPANFVTSCGTSLASRSTLAGWSNFPKHRLSVVFCR